MNRRTLIGLLGLWLVLAGVPSAGDGGDAPDRLDRFRRLAARHLGAADLAGQPLSEEVLGKIYGLLDDEIVESLATGGPFASQAFLQDRLDAFHEAWGGTALRILTLPGSEFAIGVFQLSPTGFGNSVRIYRAGGGAGLVQVIRREGVPELRGMPPTRAGEPQFLVAWVGPQSSRGNKNLALELWRLRGTSAVLVWATEGSAAGGLLVSRFALGEHELSFRYEVQYPGWKPGCAGQTEQEDFYRYMAARETFVLVRRQVHNAWHRELHAGVARFLAALNARDNRRLAALISDDRLRRTLPSRLDPDFACDAADASPPTAVSVAAVAPEEQRPWTLLFRRTREGWRLAAAVPVEPVSATIIR